MQYPKISIVTPSYNQANFLEQTVLSVIDQDYPNCEFIIIDGGSIDGSVDIIKRYEKNLAFWVSEKDSGQSNAINRGFSKCTGEVVGWLNSDDTLEKKALFNVARAFANKNTNVINGDCRTIDSNGNQLEIIRSGEVSVLRLLNFEVAHAIPPQPSIFFRHDCLRKVGRLEERLHYAMDYDLWLRMADKYAFVHVPEVLSNYRFHDNSKSVVDGGFSNFIPEWTQVRKEYLKRKGVVYTLWCKVELNRKMYRGDVSRVKILMTMLAESCVSKVRRFVARLRAVVQGARI